MQTTIDPRAAHAWALLLLGLGAMGCGGSAVPNQDTNGKSGDASLAPRLDRATGIVDRGPGDGPTGSERNPSRDLKLTDASSTSKDLPHGQEANALCSGLPLTAPEVWVDQSSSLPSIGTQTCPFHTIAEAAALPALASPAVRTIHVRGGTPQWTYHEAVPIQVTYRTILLGDGSEKTKIVAGGTCPNGLGLCAVSLASGAVLDGFTVTGTSKGVFIQSSSIPTVVRNCVVSQCGLTGIQSEGRAELGPNIQSNQNKGTGLYVGWKLTEVLAPSGAKNTFDGNDANGISINQQAQLIFGGGSVSNNGNHGIKIGVSGGTSGGLTTIKNLTAKGNGKSAIGHGIMVELYYELKLRDSVLLGNSGAGLAFDQPALSHGKKLDIGEASSPGGNTLAAPDPALRNARAGLCIRDSYGTGYLPAVGNKWSACPVLQTEFTGTCDSAHAYSDIVFNKNYSAGQPNPVNATSCTVGP